MPQHMNLKHPGDKSLLSEIKTKPVISDFTEDAKARCNFCPTAFFVGNQIKVYVVSAKRPIAKAVGIFGMHCFSCF